MAAVGSSRALGACVMLPSASGPLPATPSTLSARCAWPIPFFGNDLVAQIDALVADRHAGTGNELFDLLLALSAKRAGELGSASFAATLLSGADVTVEPPLESGDAHTEVAEHTPGPRTRIKRQRGEQVLGAHFAAPALLSDRGRTPGWGQAVSSYRAWRSRRTRGA